MYKHSSDLDAALAKIQEVGAEKPAFKEDVLEGFILLDLFRDVLGYDEDTSKRQQAQLSSGQREIPDILLKLVVADNAFDKDVIVEIKRYGHFNTVTKRVEAIKQAARYAVTKKCRFGIVTDGATWTYFVITPSRFSAKKKVAKCLVEFDVKKHPKFARALLQRSHQRRLLKLLHVLAALYETMTPEVFESVCEHRTHTARVKAVRERQDATAILSSETTLLRLLLHSDNLPAPRFFDEISPRRRVSVPRRLSIA